MVLTLMRLVIKLEDAMNVIKQCKDIKMQKNKIICLLAKQGQIFLKN